MLVLLHDRTPDGFYSAVFEAYVQKANPRFACEDFQPDFDSEILRVPTDPERATRVRDKLRKIGGAQVLRQIEQALCAGTPDRGTIAFGYVRELLAHGRDAKYMLACPAVLDFRDLVYKVGVEVHRFKGLLRFQQTRSGVYYARYEPDNDITALLLPHFCNRFHIQQFLIHDLKRNILGIYDGKHSAVCGYDRELTVYLSETEESFARLFALYYKSVNIDERKNLRQMLGYMPCRYHKYLPELHPPVP